MSNVVYNIGDQTLAVTVRTEVKMIEYLLMVRARRVKTLAVTVSTEVKVLSLQ
jgi:hypothetical protein